MGEVLGDWRRGGSINTLSDTVLFKILIAKQYELHFEGM